MGHAVLHRDFREVIATNLRSPACVMSECVCWYGLAWVLMYTLLRNGEHPPRGLHVPCLQLGDACIVALCLHGIALVCGVGCVSSLCRPHLTVHCATDNSAMMHLGIRFGEASVSLITVQSEKGKSCDGSKRGVYVFEPVRCYRRGEEYNRHKRGAWSGE